MFTGTLILSVVAAALVLVALLATDPVSAGARGQEGR